MQTTRTQIQLFDGLRKIAIYIRKQSAPSHSAFAMRLADRVQYALEAEIILEGALDSLAQGELAGKRRFARGAFVRG